MTNQNAIWIGGLVFAALAIDQIFNSGTASLFLLLKFMDLIEFVMFWR